MTAARRVPSIRSRLANALAVWSVVWSLAVGVAAWLAASHEVDELMDDGLQATAEVLARQLLRAGPAPGAAEAEADAALPAGNATRLARLAWQVVSADGRLLQRSAAAPAQPWHATATAGHTEARAWSLYGQALGSDGRMLYVAEPRAERLKAGREVAAGALVSALAVGLLGHVWLRARVRAELAPLQTLSDRLSQGEADQPSASGRGPLGPAERRELVAHAGGRPMHAALGYHWARMIEMLFAAETIAGLLDDDALEGTDLVASGERRREGVGVIEAPRGTLIHHYRVGDDDLVEMANLIVSTTHNNQAMNVAVRDVARRFLDGREITEPLLNHIEVAIRAYDPCLSCATHALGRMPLEVVLLDAAGAELDRRTRS